MLSLFLHPLYQTFYFQETLFHKTVSGVEEQEGQAKAAAGSILNTCKCTDTYACSSIKVSAGCKKYGCTDPASGTACECGTKGCSSIYDESACGTKSGCDWK